MSTISKGWITDKINGISVSHSYPCHKSNYTNSVSRNVSYVGIHYSGNEKDTALANAKYFQSANRKASAHLFVDDSHIEQSVELRDKAWSIGCTSGYKTSARNTNSINIEMCCTAGNYTISKKTQINAAYVCAYVCKLIGITANQVDTYVLRHYDCVKSNKACPKQYVDNPKEWNQFKTWVKNILNTGSYLGSTATPKYVKNGIDYSYVFDPIYYAETYSDLKKNFGYDTAKLFDHFIKNGIGELRQAKSDFNVVTYATAKENVDLRNAFGVLDIPKNKPSKNAYLYYNHYCTNGHKEKRTHI